MQTPHAAPSSALVPSSLSEVENELNKLRGALTDEIEAELVCVVCGSIFIDPRVLQCQHCFCLRCLYSTVSRDRAEKIEILCAYRCTQVTITQGDIRTLPKNHYITNTSVILRQHLARQARLLERKVLLLEAASEEASPSAENLRNNSGTFQLEDASALSRTFSAPLSQGASIATTRALLRNEVDAVKEMHECEWCSYASSTCTVCPYCWSRICAECRGQFSDHQYLCIEVHQPMRRPAVGWVRGSSSATVDVNESFSALQENEASGANTAGGTVLRAQASSMTTTQDQVASFPFFITPLFLPALVQECLVDEHCMNLQLSAIEVTTVTAIRLAVPEVEVQCRHHTTGFGFDFWIHPSFRTIEGVEADVAMQHWADGTAKPSATLSFLANAARLGETVLQNLRPLSAAMNEVVMRLSSAAHQACVRRNKGFHMYSLHVWLLVQSQRTIACDALLPHLERSRLLANIMGEVVVSQFQQSAMHASQQQKHVIRDSCVAFVKDEALLSRQLDQVMDGIDAACRGIHAQLSHMFAVMKDLAQPKVHRGEEHKRARQSRLRFSVNMFQSLHQTQHSAHAQESIMPTATPTDTKRASPCTCARAVGCSSTKSPFADQAPEKLEALRSSPSRPMKDGSTDQSVENNRGETCCSFHGQVAEHSDMTRALTKSMLSILRCFMQTRLWEWSFSNICLRECSLIEGNRRTLLDAEEKLQLITDSLLHNIWCHSRMLYTLEVDQDAAGPASSLDILMDSETLELLNSTLECPVYSHTEVLGILKSFSQLRAQSLSTNPATVFLARNSDNHEELQRKMCAIFHATMSHQTTLLSRVVAAATSLNERYAAYLCTRQVDPAVGERPSPSESTLRAIDVLHSLHRCNGEKHWDCVDRILKERSRFANVWNAHRDGKHTSCVGDSAAPQGGCLPYTHSGVSAEGAAPSQRCPFLVDFSLRDTALSSCQAYGECLVRTAHGEFLQAESVSEDVQPDRHSPQGARDERFAQDGDPASSTSPKIKLECTTVSDQELVTTRAEETSSGVSNSPAANVRENSRDVQRNAPVLNSDTTTHHHLPTPLEGDNSATHRTGSQKEFLFAADADESIVVSAPVASSMSEGNTIQRAVKMFWNAFQLPATTASVGRQRVVLLPFYRGECVYKGSSTQFYVDGQTGSVFIDPERISAAGKRLYALELLSSPLFFVLFNSALGVFLHQRCRLKMFCK